MSFPIPSSWFGEWTLVNQSKIYRQVQFLSNQEKNKFTFYELSFNEIRKWEELRIQGTFEVKENILTLKVEKCTLYGKKDIQKRWALLKSFDCDHLTWEAKFLNNQISLTEKNNAFENFDLNLVYKGNATVLKVIHQDAQELIAWGIEAKKVYKAQFGKDLTTAKQIPILSVRDSTIYFQTQKIPIQYIEVFQPKAKSFFEESN